MLNKKAMRCNNFFVATSNFMVWVLGLLDFLIDIFFSFSIFWLGLLLLSILQCWYNKILSLNSFQAFFLWKIFGIFLAHFCNLLICVFNWYICDGTQLIHSTLIMCYSLSFHFKILSFGCLIKKYIFIPWEKSHMIEC